LKGALGKEKGFKEGRSGKIRLGGFSGETFEKGLLREWMP